VDSVHLSRSEWVRQRQVCLAHAPRRIDGPKTAHFSTMADDRIRRQIAFLAAQLMYQRFETEYFTAKRKAAKRLYRRGVKPEDLPSNAEIREQIQLFARIHEGDKRTQHLRDMRLEALRLMRLLRPFRPRLIGSVMTGHVRKGSDIDLHVPKEQYAAVIAALADERAALQEQIDALHEFDRDYRDQLREFMHSQLQVLDEGDDPALADTPEPADATSADEPDELDEQDEP